MVKCVYAYYYLYKIRLIIWNKDEGKRKIFIRFSCFHNLHANYCSFIDISLSLSLMKWLKNSYLCPIHSWLRYYKISISRSIQLNSTQYTTLLWNLFIHSYSLLLSREVIRLFLLSKRLLLVLCCWGGFLLCTALKSQLRTMELALAKWDFFFLKESMPLSFKLTIWLRSLKDYMNR